MPSGAVENHDGMDVPGQRFGELGEEDVHRHGGGFRQDQGEAGIGPRLDGAEDVGPFEALVAAARRTLSLGPPTMAKAPFLPYPRLVLEPELEPLAGVRRSCRRQSFGEAFF